MPLSGIKLKIKLSLKAWLDVDIKSLFMLLMEKKDSLINVIVHDKFNGHSFRLLNFMKCETNVF